MSEVSLRVQVGRTPGSRESRRVRRQGLVPAVVYGRGVEPVPVAVDAHDLHVALHTEAGTNAIIKLEIDGGDTLTTMARVIDKHPYRNEYRHVDFVTIDLTQKVTAEVAIHFEGTPVGVREGGIFSPVRSQVAIEALPTEIPSFVELDVSEIDIGESLRIADLPEIEGVTYLEDSESVVMSVTHPVAEIEEEPEELEEEELAEGEEPAEGEEAAEPEEETKGEGGE
jgi:large subunit ribosomal protein L25